MFKDITLIIDGKSVSILIHQNNKNLQNNNNLKVNENSQRTPCFIVGLSSHYHDKFSKKFLSFYQPILLDLYWTKKYDKSSGKYKQTFSKKYIESLTVDKLADHIEIIRKELVKKLGNQYKKIFLLAHSAYGFITINYSLKYKENLHGVINLASPLTFNEQQLEAWKEEYFHSNFKSNKPTSRYQTYLKNKKALAKLSPEMTKNYFVKWYLSLGPLVWKNSKFWNNQDNKAEAIWNAWKIIVLNTAPDVTYQQRDINTTMLFHFIKLITNLNCYKQLPQITVPLLWVGGLWDSDVPLLYQFEDYEKSHSLSNNIHLFYTESGHWPMMSDDSDTTAFDKKVIEWGSNLYNK